MKKTIFLTFILFSAFLGRLYPQLHDFECGTEISQGESFTSSSFLGGKYKPHRTDIGGATPGFDHFPVLVVFVQFQNEPGDVTNMDINYWRPGYPPNYINQVVRQGRNELTNWWDSYNGYDWSDFWHEYSRGKHHVTGRAVSVILPHDYQWYVNYSTDHDIRRGKVNRDVYDVLNDPALAIDWLAFDRWTCNSEGNFSWEPDGRVDMLIKVHRHDPERIANPIWTPNASGYIPLGPCEGAVGNEYTVYQSGSTVVKINGAGGGDGSGGVVNGKNGIVSREFWFGTATHELGHYMWGSGHHQYCKVVAGLGGEMGLSPWEVVKMGYIQQKFVNYSNPNHALYDYSSRSGMAGSQGEILQVPINQDGSEFFLIANRRKVSEWDSRMGGDTVPGLFFKNINPEYGKGVYIYHIRNGYNEPSTNRLDHDLECADGLWNWEQQGTASPVWDQSEVHPAFIRSSVVYAQDNPGVTNDIGKDGMSLVKTGYVNGEPKIMWGNWYSQGKSNTYNPLTYGIDRLYTNDKNFWHSLELAGDRWDAWNVGYNEVFSPWSSPNTNDWNNQQTGIYIWYSNLNAGYNGALLKVYRVGENGESDSTILLKTPPSRPMGVKSDYYYPDGEGNGPCHPRITWNHNQEPDMLDQGTDTKRYKVYRAEGANMGYVPANYIYLATVNVRADRAPSYIDYSVIGPCSTVPDICCWQIYPLRYYIKAVDTYSDSSVASDFVYSEGLKLVGKNPEVQEGPGYQGFIPSSFSIKNFPNPFNPVTKIQYDLPHNVFVSIKIYDITGREISTLVNEFKEAGYYITSFDGSNLSSGTYFYKIEAGNFEAVRKMILLK